MKTGFISSPFILNYVIKHHLEKFPDDPCTKILRENFYVDNLYFTGNDVESLQNLYSAALNRMNSGGFQLRSWASNSSELRETFINDGTCATHSSDHEKVLGYKYFPQSDSLALNDVDQTQGWPD